MNRKSSRNVIASTFLIVVLAANILFLITLPSNVCRVHLVASVTKNSVAISECNLKKQSLIGLISPKDNMPVRASTITLSVGDELEADGYRFPFFDVAKTYVGTGIYIFNSPTIPILKTGTPLLVSVCVNNPDGSVYAQNETTIPYK
jgi:hypothetical protein